MDWLRLKPSPARRGPEKSNCYSLITVPAGLWPAAKGQKPKIRPVPARPGLEPDRAASEGLSSCLVVQNNQQTSSYNITLMVVVGHGQRDAVVPYAVPFRSGNYSSVVPFRRLSYSGKIRNKSSAVPFRKLSYSCKIRNTVPFRSGNYTILVTAGTLPVPFRRLSYSGKIRNETQSFRSAVPFCSGNYNNP